MTLALVMSTAPADSPAAEPPVARASATCADYSNQADAQRAKDTRDADGDGIYCESLPCPCLKPGGGGGGGGGGNPTGCHRVKQVVRVRFDDDRWPNIARHIRFAKRLRKSSHLR